MGWLKWDDSKALGMLDFVFLLGFLGFSITLPDGER